jgi:hypothetical protein
VVASRSSTCRELFDRPDAPRPDPDTPAPVRLLYDFDNLLLAHADRRRTSTDAFRRAFAQRGGPTLGAVLVDGITAAHWTLGQSREEARVTVHLHRPGPATETDAITAEAAHLLAFVAPDSVREVRVLADDGAP